MARGRTDTGANVGFEGELWKAADALRGSMDAAEFKHAPDLGFTARTVPEFEAAPDHCIDLHRSLARLRPLLRRPTACGFHPRSSRRPVPWPQRL